AQLVGQVVDAGVDARDVHAHQVAAQLLHGVHVALHLSEGGRARLVEDAVEVNRLVIQVHLAAPRLDFAQPEARLNLGHVAGGVDELGHEAVA
nr:hypothetical protein [Tanacetum cinerariifolium]